MSIADRAAVKVTVDSRDALGVLDRRGTGIAQRFRDGDREHRDRRLGHRGSRRAQHARELQRGFLAEHLDRDSDGDEQLDLAGMADRFVAGIGEADEPPGPARGRLGHPGRGRDFRDRQAAAVRPEQRVQPGAVQRAPLVRLDDLVERDALAHQPLQELEPRRGVRCRRVVDTGGDERIDVHPRPAGGQQVVGHQPAGIEMP